MVEWCDVRDFDASSWNRDGMLWAGVKNREFPFILAKLVLFFYWGVRSIPIPDDSGGILAYSCRFHIHCDATALLYARLARRPAWLISAMGRLARRRITFIVL